MGLSASDATFNYVRENANRSHSGDLELTHSIDLVIEQDHPRAGEFQSAATEAGLNASVCSQTHWNAAISSGSGDRVILFDRAASLSPQDLSCLVNAISASRVPVMLTPVSDANGRVRAAWDCLPAVVSACWCNPLGNAVVSLQRADFPKLPPIVDGQPDNLWEWLTRASLQPGIVKWEEPAIRLVSAGFTETRDRLPALVPQPAPSEAKWLIEHISRLKPSQLVPEKTSEADAVAVKAGLLQWHDALDASHELSQSVEGLGRHQAGDYWHAINHRREPDYGNSKYWFRQFGTHPLFAELPAVVAPLLEHAPDGGEWKSRLFGRGVWDPLAFVDLCQSCAGHEDSPLGLRARKIQAAEMLLLMVFTWHDASGK